MKVKTKLLPYALLASLSLISCATASDAPAEKISNKEKVIALLEGLETGDPTGASYIHPEKYIQHNLGVADGPNGFAELMKNAPEGGVPAPKN